MIRPFTAVLLLVFSALLGCEDTVIVDDVTGDDLVNPSIQPRVIYAYPGGGIGPFADFTTGITVQFNKLMDPASLKQALHFDSPAGDLKIDTDAISFVANYAYTFRVIRTVGNVAVTWRIGETYALTIDSSARDLNGNSLGTSHLVSFIPEPYFRVSRFTPLPGSEEINVTASISVRFNSAIDPSMFRFLRITPEVPGYWTLPIPINGPADSSRIVFQRTSGATLTSGTTYSVTVDSALADVEGRTLGHGYGSVFKTARFEVTSTSPSDGSLYQSSGRFDITIRLNEGVDAGSIDSAISITPPIQWRSLTNPGSTSITITPDEPLPTGSEITVTVDTTLRSESGTHLEAPYSFRFFTENFKVVNPWAGSTSFEIDRYERVYFYFNGILDTGSVRGAVSIDPPHPVLFNLTESVSSFSLAPISGYIPKSTYTIRIDTSLKSTSGQPVEAPQAFSFLIEPFKLYSTSPPDGYTMTPRNGTIGFSFNDYLDTTTVAGSLTIQPAVPGRFIFPSYTPQTRSFTFRPDDLLAALTLFTVTIDTSLRTRDGYRLDTPVITRFSTGY